MNPHVNKIIEDVESQLASTSNRIRILGLFLREISNPSAPDNTRWNSWELGELLLEESAKLDAAQDRLDDPIWWSLILAVETEEEVSA